MTTSEPAPAGRTNSASGSPVARAAALAVLAEEPATGLFPPAKPTAAAASAAPPVSTASAPSAAVAQPGSVPAARPAPQAEEGRATAEHEAAPAEAEPEESRTTAAAEEGRAAGEAASAEESPAAGEAARTGATAEAEGSTAAKAEGLLAANGRPATVSRRTVGLPLGRPGRPMIAAAIIGGLVLVGVPFLISGPHDKDAPSGANAPAGSPMGPDGSGPGLVPGEQEAPDSGTLEDNKKSAARSGTPTGTKEKQGGTGGVHEGGGVTANGATEKDSASAAAGSKKTAKGSTASGSATTPTSGSGSDSAVAAGEASGTTATTSGKTSGTSAAAASDDAPKSSVVYTGVTGQGCPTPSGGGFQRDGFFTSGTSGWYTRTSGGSTAGGCNGGYLAVPMSGDAGTDAGSRVKWWWKPGTKARTCQISVFVPHSNTTLYVGGHPTTYHVLVNANDRTTKYDSFSIDQASHRGQWVNAGTFAMKGSTIGVKLLDRGDDWSAGWKNAHHAAAQMKVTCRS
ncbi:hypothetical protein ABT025_14000 [Streptomyces sp. NPDC002809]|uniref:hypothetical protein n=1 Tax=Streptomyces sp. NPDC002809 TaxID=3154433 RepID=UPI003329EF8F